MLNITENIIDWTKAYFLDNPNGKAVIGISGGKDSTICAAILKEAIGADRIIAVMMPNTVQKDIADSFRVCDYLGIPEQNRHVVNIGATYEQFLATLTANVWIPNCEELTDPKLNPVVTTNLPARLRMCTLYAIAAMYPGSRVVNTSNFSEKYIGYSTKWGDGVGDFSIIGSLLVKEVLEIGDDLKLPRDLVHKIPADGMSGKSDEDKIGFSYKDLDNYLSGQSDVPTDIVKKIERMHRANTHKVDTIPTFNPFSDEESDFDYI